MTALHLPPLLLAALTHKIADKNGVGAGQPTAGIKDQITLSVTISGIFDDTSVLTELIAVDPVTVDDDGTEVTVVAPNGLLVGFSKSFPAIDILNAGGEVSHKLTVAANQFKRKYTADDPTKNKDQTGQTFEDDNMTVRARAQVTDKAGNSTPQAGDLNDVAANGALSATFTLDSKPPKVTIAHPDSSHKRYTALSTQLYSFIGIGDDVDNEDLNPLNFSSDEATAGESFIIIGADSLIIDAVLIFLWKMQVCKRTWERFCFEKKPQ